MARVLIFLAFAGVALAAVPVTENKQAEQEMVSVTVYFESYCPDSIKFLTHQLYPVTQIPNLMNHINLTLVPYGKSETTKTDSGYEFKCHHGEKECIGNKILACVLQKDEVELKEKLKFINCAGNKLQADPKLTTYPTEDCVAGSSMLKAADIDACSNGSMGSEELAKYGNMTKEFGGLKNVPTIVFNNKFNEVEHMLATSNFKKALCDKLTTKPAECASTGNSGALLQAAILPVFAAIALVSRA